jgi:tetratricopeptide (TPR) repeat protein
MLLEIFEQSLFVVARLVERGEHDDALLVLRPWIETPLPPFQKMITCVNSALIYAMKSQVADALAWYDRAIGYERPLNIFFAAERKAAYLAEQGRTSESLAIYEGLLWESSLKDEDRERIQRNIQTLRTGQ